MLAIVGGLIAGAFCGCVYRRTPWTILAFVSFTLVVMGFAFPFAGIFLCIPAGVFVVVFATASDIVWSHLPQMRTVDASSADGQQLEARLKLVRYILRWVAGTYLFWVAVSLINFELLGFLVIPPLVLVFPTTVERFLPFILPPLSVAVGVAVIVTAVYLFLWKKPGSKPYMAPFIFNGCVLFVFLLSAEGYSRYLMSQSLLGHVPNRLQSSSFIDSALSYRAYFRGPHASFDEEGKTYRWSYSERKFFSSTIDRAKSCVAS